MLSIEKLSVYYGARCVLHNISLEVNSGEVLALIGPNGAGKSTLVRAASGVIPVKSGILRSRSPSAGDQTWRELNALSAMERARSLAVVPQAASMPPAFTVWETVLMGRTPHLNFLGQISAKDEEIAHRALQKVDALDLSERRVGELSGGEQQRVLLARGINPIHPDPSAGRADLKPGSTLSSQFHGNRQGTGPRGQAGSAGGPS